MDEITNYVSREEVYSRYIGETSACNFRYKNPARENSEALTHELRFLDYSPVMKYFLGRRIDRVDYHDRGRAVFVFSFKDGTALELDCANGAWSTPFTSGKSGVAAVGVSIAPDESCIQCGHYIIHPAHNRPLDYCPSCGVPTAWMRNQATGAVSQQPASQPPAQHSGVPVPAPRPSTHALINPPTAKCPSCWYPFEVTQELINRVGIDTGVKTRSGCASKCSVNTRELFKRLAEAFPAGIIVP